MAFVVSAGQLAALDKTPVSAVTGLTLSTSYVADYATLWRTQPQLRTVVSFLARNIAQLGLHVYKRESDVDRVRLTDHPLAQLLNKPNPHTTRYRLIDSLVQDLAVYDNAYLMKIKVDGANPSGVLRLPPSLVTPTGDNTLLGPTGYELRGSRAKKILPVGEVVHFRGHNPTDSRVGASPIESLRRILAEEHQAAAYREQLWRNGARMGGYLRRPADAPEWGDKARVRFRTQWQQQYTGDGPNAGGTPILEDGMEWVAGGMTPEQAQYLEARKLTREEVAAAYHIPLPMVGILDHATFSNVAEQHKQLYQDTLGPWLVMIAEEVELQLLADLPDPDGVYVEFNLAEKLRGSFEEQATQLQTAVGAPWLTRNEARARMNLPQIGGGDDLVTPMNVLVGGQASPTDSAPEPGQASRAPRGKVRGGTFNVKARVGDVADLRSTLEHFFDRQKQAVLSRLGAKATADWWDDERWNAELGDALFASGAAVTADAAAKTLERIGVDPAKFDLDRARAWLRKHADGVAEGINGRTKAEVAAALDDGVDAVKTLFEGVVVARAAQIATTHATALSGFGTTEAVQQVGATASKTWQVTSRNPRPSHASMSGETVGMDDLFSNGGRWPGDSTLPDDERANCSCELDITVED